MDHVGGLPDRVLVPHGIWTIAGRRVSPSQKNGAPGAEPRAGATSTISGSCMTCAQRGRSILRIELQRRRIDAVAKARRVWAILEDVPQMAAACGAHGLGSGHEEGTIRLGGDYCRVGRGGEARPARTRVELRVGPEQLVLQPAQRYAPGRCSSHRPPVKARSVPFCRRTLYCSGVRTARHSASDLAVAVVDAVLSSVMGYRLRRYCGGCDDRAQRVRRAPARHNGCYRAVCRSTRSVRHRARVLRSQNQFAARIRLPMADRTVWRWCAEWNPPLLHRLEHEHRDLPVRPRLVRRVVGPGLDRVLPPDSLLVARDLARRVVALGRAVLQLDVRGLLEVRVPGGILRGAAE